MGTSWHLSLKQCPINPQSAKFELISKKFAKSENIFFHFSSHLSPLTSEVVGAPQMTLQLYLPPYPVFRCPQGISKPFPVHSLMLSPYLFFCFPLLLAPFTVPCRIVFAMPEELEMWPYHLSFRFFFFFTTVRRSSCTPIAF